MKTLQEVSEEYGLIIKPYNVEDILAFAADKGEKDLLVSRSEMGKILIFMISTRICTPEQAQEGWVDRIFGIQLHKIENEASN